MSLLDCALAAGLLWTSYGWWRSASDKDRKVYAVRRTVGDKAVEWCVRRINREHGDKDLTAKTAILAGFINTLYVQRTGETPDKMIVAFLARYYAQKAWK